MPLNTFEVSIYENIFCLISVGPALLISLKPTKPSMPLRTSKSWKLEPAGWTDISCFVEPVMCWSMSWCTNLKGKGHFFIIGERHSINLAKGNQGLAWRALKRFDSQNEFNPDEGWRNRDREVVGANLCWQPCDFHSDWLFKARLEAWRIFTSFPAKNPPPSFWQ